MDKVASPLPFRRLQRAWSVATLLAILFSLGLAEAIWSRWTPSTMVTSGLLFLLAGLVGAVQVAVLDWWRRTTQITVLAAGRSILWAASWGLGFAAMPVLVDRYHIWGIIWPLGLLCVAQALLLRDMAWLLPAGLGTLVGAGTSLYALALLGLASVEGEPGPVLIGLMILLCVLGLWSYSFATGYAMARYVRWQLAGPGGSLFYRLIDTSAPTPRQDRNSRKVRASQGPYRRFKPRVRHRSVRW